MSLKIYYINRYHSKLREDVKNHSGYEQLVNYAKIFRPIKSDKYLGKIAIKMLPFPKPKDYRTITLGKELLALCKALITGNPVFYLYADKDAYLLPLIKRKFDLKRIKLFGTLHWPKEISAEFSFYKYNLANQFNGIITLSSSLKKEFSIKRIVIPHGVDLNFWKNDDLKNFDNSYLVLGISNRDHEGQIGIIDQIKKIDPQAKFTILLNDPEIFKLYAVIQEVEIIKERKSDRELKKLYQKSKAVILIQKFSLASNVVLECMSMQIPLLANRVGDIEEYLGREYPLFLDETQQDEIIEDFCYNPNFRDRVSDYLGQIRNNFGWKPIAERTITFIKKES